MILKSHAKNRISSAISLAKIMAQPADDPKDVLDFKFRAVRKIKLHSDNVPEPKNPTQKLAVANSLGRLFAGLNL